MNCDQFAGNQEVKLPDGAWIEKKNHITFLISKNWPLINDHGFRKNINERTQGGCLHFSKGYSKSLGNCSSTAPSSVEFIGTGRSLSISWNLLNSGIV